MELNSSSREVTFSEITVDFTQKNITNLPFIQQEVKIIDKQDNLKFTGFVSGYSLPELRLVDIDRELSISLFSPRQMTTKRIVTIVTTDTLTNVINRTLNPLFQDGFILKEQNFTDKIITVTLISRTVEEVLNYLSKKYSLYWNIDKNKNITINSIEYQFNKPIKKNININNYKEQIKGFISLSPTVENVDYANIINVKNARVFYKKHEIIDGGVTLKKGDRLDFENPIDISLNTAERIEKNLIKQNAGVTVTNLCIGYDNDKTATITSKFNVSTDLKSRHYI